MAIGMTPCDLGRTGRFCLCGLSVWTWNAEWGPVLRVIATIFSGLPKKSPSKPVRTKERTANWANALSLPGPEIIRGIGLVD